MRWIGFAASAAVFLAAAFPAAAQAPTPLMQEKGCLACHDVSQAKMGPSLAAIAAQYKGQPDAEQKLVTELKTGTGHIKVDASDAELQQLVSSILATR